ncbi:hypothetical protein ACFPM7_20275 [Actinokineospora guangxiensis]|uniref:Small secreted protein n=1 Tax=Actinokineospora guangxiensis TaxID=1490288 RepID=A0ABW0ETE0_9PSEU
MKPRLAGAAIFAFAAVALTAGCGSDDAAPPVLPAPGATSAQAPPADLDDPVVAWAERVCGVVEQGGRSLARFPAVDPNDPAKTKRAMVDYLKAISAELGKLGEGISSAGAPPVDGGDAAVEAALQRIATLRASLADAQEKLSAVPATDPAAFQAALADLGPKLEGLHSAEGPTADLKANPELKEAFSSAPTCRRVEGA